MIKTEPTDTVTQPTEMQEIDSQAHSFITGQEESQRSLRGVSEEYIGEEYIGLAYQDPDQDES